MPDVSLPADFIEQLEQSESGTINDTDGPGVAVYWATDRSVRADIYIGLKLDGLKLYQNIGSVNPNITMQFSIPPTVSCKHDLDFDPDKEKVIAITVSCSLNDYDKSTYVKKPWSVTLVIFDRDFRTSMSVVVCLFVFISFVSSQWLLVLLVHILKIRIILPFSNFSNFVNAFSM